ncbi:uncharacterized protein B0I36DRAFT_319335 [Microdochium trichocladiopsis]|uniref:Uncharacterized protein n=1 Tax=Microdochium trichocladiopsis TaxID=1682393 RepID=A0A9P9BXB4_9PEZI|nr:uncharacterized protein B0I36DRAFT_319335 [Microdochium trichocladiopsis]KAH7035911.1 hypothetical protein B0I36DRAFT_319335 [Microdochium trichocladiopsis]
MASKFNLEQDGLGQQERLACRRIQEMYWALQLERDAACEMLLDSQIRNRPVPRPRATTVAELATTIYYAPYTMSVALLIACAERSLGYRVLFSDAWVFETMAGPTWLMLKMDTTSGTSVLLVGSKAVLITNALVNPNDRYRNSMTPRMVQEVWNKQRELLTELGNHLRLHPSTIAWLLRQVQYHDPTQPPSNTRARRQITDTMAHDNGTASPTFYQLILDWAVGFGQINKYAMDRLREKRELYLIAAGPMAMVLEEEVKSTGEFDAPVSPRGIRLQNERAQEPRKNHAKPVTIAMMHASTHGEWPGWFRPNAQKAPPSQLLIDEIGRLGWTPNIDVATLQMEEPSDATASTTNGIATRATRNNAAPLMLTELYPELSDVFAVFKYVARLFEFVSKLVLPCLFLLSILVIYLVLKAAGVTVQDLILKPFYIALEYCQQSIITCAQLLKQSIITCAQFLVICLQWILNHLDDDSNNATANRSQGPGSVTGMNAWFM